MRVAKIVWGKAPSATAGTPFSTVHPPKIKVLAETADGKIIKGLYANPIRLQSSDKSGAVQVQINGGNIGAKQLIRKSTDVVWIDYTGLAIPPVTLAADAKGTKHATTRFAPTLPPIVLSSPQRGDSIYLSSTLSFMTFSASEVGWTNAPYNKTLSVSVPSSCANIASAGSAKVNTFAVSVGSSLGTCNIAVYDFAHGQSLSIAVSNNPTYTVWLGGQAAQGPSGKPPFLQKVPPGCSSGESCAVSVGGGYFQPRAIAFNSSGAAFVADDQDPNMFVIPAGRTSTSCTTQIAVYSDLETGITVDAAGNAFLSEQGSLYEIPSGCLQTSCVETTIPPATGAYITSVAAGPNNTLYVLDFNHGLYSMPEIGCASLSCATAIPTPVFEGGAVAVDSQDNVYVGGSGYPGVTSVYEIPNGCASTSCEISLGGNFADIVSIAVDPLGAVYVVDELANYAGQTGPTLWEMPPGCSSGACISAVASYFSYLGALAVTAPASAAAPNH